MQFCLLSIFILAHSISAANSGFELIKNGSFESDTQWNLAINGDAAGKGMVQNGTYTVTVTNQGSEDWYIQLTQGNISVKKDFFYTFSFEVSASTQRKMVTSICKNGDDYAPYSKRDTIRVDTTFFKYSQIFQMKQMSDSTARVELNFGKYPGDIKIRRISLIGAREPQITISRIEPQNIVESGSPVRISWRSIALQGPLSFSVSYDNGTSWSLIDTNLSVTDSMIWIAGTIYTPWCLFKLSTPTIATISATPLQIVPLMNIIKNGSFSSQLSNWLINTNSLGDSLLKISTDSGLCITMDNPASGENRLILSQSSIKLSGKTDYELFFTCYSRAPSVVKVVLSNSTNKYSSSSDTAVFNVSDKVTRFQTRFTSQKTQTDGLIVFIVGIGRNDIYFKDISLITLPDTTLSNRSKINTRNKTISEIKSFFSPGISRTYLKYPHVAFDLSGRKLNSYSSDNRIRVVNKNRSSGIIITVPNMQNPKTPSKQH